MKTYEKNLQEALEKIANGRKVNNRKVIHSDRSWHLNAEGCRECFSSNMDSIYAAYNESKICGEW